VYNGNTKKRHQVWTQNKIDTFTFSYSSKPDLVNVDGDKVLLAEKKDNKTLENFIHQYKYAGTYLDRREAIDAASKKQDDQKALELMKVAMKDKYHGLRNFAISKLDMKKENIRKEVEPILADLARNDEKSTVRASAIGVLANYENAEYKTIFIKGVNDSSYTVAGNSLEALARVDSAQAIKEAKRLGSTEAKGKLVEAITKVMIRAGDESGYNVIAGAFGKMPLSQAKFNLVQPFTEFMATVQNTKNFKEGIDMIVDFRTELEPYGAAPVINNFLKGVITKKESAKTVASDKGALQEQIDYVKAKVGDEKKGF
jgi:aminopeptidase N